MPQSLCKVYLHLIFSTKHRRPFLADPDARRSMHATIAEISNRRDCQAIEVGGFDDHIHVLARLGKGIGMSDWVRDVKRYSSEFGKKIDSRFAWQAGYGLFSVEAPSVQRTAAYVKGQEAHHTEESFQDEFRRLLLAHDLEWDEQYVWE